jgi:hypothetical protein
MQRCLRVTVALGTLLAALATATAAMPASAATPTPTPTPSSSAFQQTGVSVTPVPHDTYASTSGTHLELGDVTPGSRVRDRVRILNIGPDPLPVDLYAADAIPAVNGGFGFTARTEATNDVGSWIHLAARHLNLPGHSTTTVSFTLLAPTGAPGGEHVGAIVAEPTSASGSSGVQTKTRFAMAVYLRLPGAPAVQPPAHPQTVVTVTKLDVGTSGRTVCPTMSLRNDTPDVIDPSLKMSLTSSLGFGTKRLTIPHLGGILPGAQASTHLPCFSGADPGPSKLKVVVTSPRGARSLQQDVGIYPWPLFLALLLLLLLLLLVARELYKRWRERQREIAELRAAVHGRSGTPGTPGAG